MKKSLIALAVAGAFSAPAFAATSNVDIYGIMSFSVDHANTDDSTIDKKDIVTGRDNVSRLGFKGSEDLGGGLSAIWQIEMQLNANSDAAVATSTNGTGYVTNVSFTAGSALRNTFVGLKSDSMGTLILGRYDTPYKSATSKLDPFADNVGDYNAIIGRSSGKGAGSLFDVRSSNLVEYMTPSVNGLMGAVAYSQPKYIEPTATEGDVSLLSLMASYDNGPIFASLAYEKHTNTLGAASTDAIHAWKAGAGYSFGDAKIGGVYERISGGDTNGAAAGGEANARNAYYLSGQYNMGNIALKAAYGHAGDSNATATADDGAKFYALGADYNLSKRTTVFGVYTKLNNNGTVASGGGYDLVPYGSSAKANDPSVFSVGVKHSF
jgi:predicted porin